MIKYIKRLIARYKRNLALSCIEKGKLDCPTCHIDIILNGIRTGFISRKKNIYSYYITCNNCGSQVIYKYNRSSCKIQPIKVVRYK